MNRRRRLVFFRSMSMGCAAMVVVGIVGFFVFGASAGVAMVTAVFVLLAIGFALAVREVRKDDNEAEQA